MYTIIVKKKGKKYTQNKRSMNKRNIYPSVDG